MEEVTRDDESADTPVELPEALIPAAPVVIDLDDDRELSADETRLQLRALHRLDLGFERPPFDPKTTEVMVRGAHRKILQGWLEMGWFLLEAKLVMGTKPYREWFKACGFPFGVRWAQMAIATVLQLNADPVLAGLARRISSVKHFQLVARRLGTPDGREEWESSERVYGRSIDELNRLKVAQFGELTAGDEHDADPGAIRDQAQVRERLERERIDAGKKSLDLEVQLKERTEELLEVRRQLAAVAHPHLNASQIEVDFLKRLEEVRTVISSHLAELRPKDRRDLEVLTPQAIAQFYADGILWEKQVALLLREIEEKWGARMPELLLNENGQWREPAHRAELKVLREDIRDTRDAVAASAGGGRLTIVSDRKENRGEILFSSSAEEP